VMRKVVDLGLAVLLFTAGGSFPISAQGPASPSSEELQKLQELADQVRVALQRGDLGLANRLSSDLMLGIFKQRQALEPTPQEKFVKLEQDAPPNGTARFYALSDLAKAAFAAGDSDKAEYYGRELLSLAPQYQKNWNYGNAVFFGNMIIGRVALKRDKNPFLAKRSLLASAETAGSPTLNSFGPNMSLAKDLLSLGERDTVLEFFALCRKFWKSEKLDDWAATVRGGGMPDFGANLMY